MTTETRPGTATGGPRTGDEAGGTLAGRLSPARFGASMPVDAPYYPRPPFFYRDARALSVSYETDADAAADLLPLGLELPLPAVATLIVVDYPFSTFGPYQEAILGLSCRLEGEGRFYIAHIAVNTVPPLVGGREIWGFPKKLADIALYQDEDLLVGTLERPKGVRLATVSMRLERPLEVPTGGGGGGSLALRVIPSPEAGKPPSLAELVETAGGERTTHEAWSGPVTVSFDTRSELDPWYRLPVRRVIGATCSRYDFVLPHGRVVRTY